MCVCTWRSWWTKLQGSYMLIMLNNEKSIDSEVETILQNYVYKIVDYFCQVNIQIK